MFLVFPLRRYAIAGATAAMLALTPYLSVRAQDASFGCKVLLCAAASNPSWSGIPYCVPVMTQLFRMLARGRPWPTCPEGNAGGLGYDPYLPCPAPMIAYSGGRPTGGDNGPEPLRPDPNGDQCADPARVERACQSRGDNGAVCDPADLPIARPQRENPHYVDITSGGQTSRFYFSLRGY
jgi:hypothetical protein